MCKLFIATGRFSPAQVRGMLDAANASFAQSQRDGFGFVAYGNRKVAHGRYLDPLSYGGFGVKMPAFVRSQQIESGRLPHVTTALVIHGRTSTNSVRVENCHPFSRDDVYLAHNGVLSWIGEGSKPESRHGCDTDEFFAWLHGHKNPGDAWGSTHQRWSGYGVFGIVESSSGKLTVAKCGSGKLAWAGNNDAHVFSTEHGDVTRIARGGKLDVCKPVSVEPKTIIRYDVRRGLKLDSVSAWDGFGTAVRDVRWFRSMGDDVDWRSKYTPSVEVKSGKVGEIAVPRDRGVRAKRNRELFPDWEPSESTYNGQITEL